MSGLGWVDESACLNIRYCVIQGERYLALSFLDVRCVPFLLRLSFRDKGAEIWVGLASLGFYGY